MKWKSLIIALSICSYPICAFADFERYQTMLDQLTENLRSKGVEKIEFRKPEELPFGGMEIAALWVKFADSDRPTFLGMVTLKQGLMFPDVPFNDVRDAVVGLIEKAIARSQQETLSTRLPVIDLFAADHLKTADDMYKASLSDPPQMRMNDPIANAAAFAANIMLNAGLNVRIKSIVPVNLEHATMSVSNSDVSIHEVIYEHTMQPMINIRIELHSSLSDNVPQLVEKILDQAQSLLLARFADSFTMLVGDLRTRATIIKLSREDFAPLSERTSFEEFAGNKLFFEFFRKLPTRQQNAVKSLFTAMGGGMTSVELIQKLNLMFVELRDNGEKAIEFLNLISALKQVHAVQHTDDCSQLFKEAI